MITRVDARLRREAAELALRFSCEQCAHFAPDTASCANGYPNHAHVDARLESRETLTFCKEFELA